MIQLSYCNRLLDEGFSLITAGEDKVPNIPWKKYQNEKISKTQFEIYYNFKGDDKRKATKIIGLCTGFNNLEVFDIDLKILPSLKLQQDFWNEYVSLLKENIDDFDNKFVIYKTISNGYHILYKCKEIAGNQKIAKLKDYKEAIIETRGIGGYVVIYENQVSKLAYKDIKEISIHDRQVLFSCSKLFNYIDESSKPVEEKKQIQSVEAPEQEIKVWDDYNNRTDIWDLISNDFDVIKKLSDKTIIRRIGASSAHSGYVYSDSGCMYLFTTGTIYPNEKLLSPFAIYTYKYHNGNFSDSSKDLYLKGYGSRIVRKPEVLDNTPILENINFPIEVFPVDIQNYILECSKTLDSSVDFMGASMLWLLSVIIGNSVKVEVKNGWVESANIWISCVGRAGIGKTPSINNIIYPLLKLNNREIKNYIKNYEKYEAYRDLDKKEKQNAEVINKPNKTQFIVNDVTLEALVELHEENKNSIGVFKDELAGWFKDMNKYRAGSDLEFWLSSWSNKGVSVNRKTAKSSFVASPIIPVLGGIQPSILTQFFTEENKDNGFIDRMLLVFPDLQVEMYNKNEMNQEISTWYSDFITQLFDFVKNHLIQYDEDFEIHPITVRFSREASIEWERIFNSITMVQNSEDETEYFKSMLPKQKSYIPRFSLLLYVFNCLIDGELPTLIDKQTILNAEKLSNYFINNAKKIKFDSIEKNEVKKIIEYNKTKSKKEQVLEIYKNNPNISKIALAEAVGVSRKTIHQYLKNEN